MLRTSRSLELDRLPPSDNANRINRLETTSRQAPVDNVDNADPAHASPSPSEDPPTGPPSLTTTTIAWTMISLCLSVLLSALDLTIVTPAIPSIVSTSKTVAGRRLGRKPIILIAMAVFLVGSVVCALAPHMNALLVGRVIQGVGGSGMGTMVNIVVCDMLSLRDRGLYLAVTSLVWAVGSTVGPVLGGWRWCFWINLPAGAISLLVLLFCMKVPNPRTPIAAGLKWKLARNPIIPPPPFHLPLKGSYIRCLRVRNCSHLWTLPPPSNRFMLPRSRRNGSLIQQTGMYLPVMYVAQAFLTLGAGLLVSLHFETSITRLIIFQTIAGIGVSMNIDAPILAAQAATTVRDTAAVTATMGFVRSLATAVSVVVGGVVFQNQMNAKNAGLVKHVGVEIARGFNGELAASNLEEQAIVRETYFGALRSVWVMYVAFAGLASILNLLVRAHKLKNENEGAVLGAVRVQQEPSPSVNQIETNDAPSR
ncbi:major facilitator superfamily domain-containing protein [Aspergillus spectabilis]